MKLFYGMKDVMDMGLENMTEKDLQQMEAQGCDVTELRQKMEEKKAKLERAGETDISRLDPYINTPRSTDTEFFKVNAGKPPFFGKEKFFQKYTNANIVFCVVVQAAPSLYRPGDDPSAAIVVLHGLDQKHNKDFDFLRKVADYLVAMRDGEKETSANLKKLVKDLNNPKSHIHTKISGEEINPQEFVGAELLLDTVYTSQSRLPGTRIPNDRVLAMLKVSPSEDHTYYQLIQGKFYEKN